MKETRSELIARVVAENRARDQGICSEQRHIAREQADRDLQIQQWDTLVEKAREKQRELVEFSKCDHL